jgi:hypothetical protein
MKRGYCTWSSFVGFENILQAPPVTARLTASVNGIGTTRSGLEMIVQYMHKTFGRHVLGVHNKTYGLWFDLVECIVQRDILWPTADVRDGYQVSGGLLGERVRRVVSRRGMGWIGYKCECG